MYIVNGNRPKLSKKNTYRLMLKNNVCQQGSHGLAAKTLKREAGTVFQLVLSRLMKYAFYRVFL